jgi:myo-inositol catabolism protein IolH
MQLASILPLYRWSGPDEDERQAAVRYWKRAIQLCVDVGCTTMNSEFNGRPDQPARSEGQFWRSLEELLPIFEREGIRLNLEAHPDDFIELNGPAIDLVRAIDSPLVGYVYCMPHTFHLGDDIAAMIEASEPVLRQVHVADVLDHRASSGLRYIVNPPGSTARVHQHLDIGQGEVDFEAGFGALARVGFDGILTSCVFAWEERAVESSQFMFEEIRRLLAAASPTTRGPQPATVDAG